MNSSYRRKCVNGISKPDKKRIAKHWDVNGHTCMACGIEDIVTDRAHIIPLQYNGSNDLENLHLLCRTCHAESENLTGNGYKMWLQLKNELYTKGSFCGMYCMDVYNRFIILDRIIRAGKKGVFEVNLVIPQEDALNDVNPIHVWNFLNKDLLKEVMTDDY